MTTIPAYSIGGITRPELHLDPAGNIILDPAAQAFAGTYGLKALYLGCPPNTPWPPVTGSLAPPVDTNGAANSVVEGAPANTPVNITAQTTSLIGAPVTYSLTSDSSGGGFKINATTGVVSVADPTKVDFESSAGHAYSITVRASDGTFTSSQAFTIGVSDVAPATPTDSNVAGNTVAEGAVANTLVGIKVQAPDINGGTVTYSLSNNAGGAFKIDATTGEVSVADPTKIDFETSGPGHSYTITAVASDGTLTSSQNFTIAVTDVGVSTPVDTNAAANTVIEGAANGTTVGITASGVDPNGPASSYTLIGDSSLGGFTINAATGVVTVADSTKIDFESAPGHAYSITVQATAGATTASQIFTIAVTDVAPSKPVDSDAAANTVVEGAANGSTVGITASSTDVNGPAVTYSLTGDTSGGGFTINAATGVVTVADSTKIDFETAAGHAYTITAQASDGQGGTSSQTFTIGVTDVAPSVPVDGNAAANTVVEGAAAGTAVGVTASATDVNGPGVTYSLTGDTSGGGFTINSATGVITVADPTKIDYESSAGHAYTVTAQASDGTLTSSQAFTIGVTDAAPSKPVDSDAAANTVVEGAANGSTVGITASSADVNGPAVTYSLTGDTSGGGFTINATTGVVTVADSTKIDFETAAGHAYTVTAQASDGTLTNSQTFTIGVTDVAPSAPVDIDGATNVVAQGAAAGTYTGVTAQSTDINGGTITYSIAPGGDSSGGGFTVNSATGAVTVADPSKIIFNAGSPTYNVTVDSSDGTLHNQQTFTINVILDSPPAVTAGHTVTYTENGAPVAVDPALTVVDTDNATLAHATVQITGNYVNGEDILGFTNQNGITGSFDAATGTLTLTGSSSVANYQTALASVSYFNTSENPSGAPRTVTIIANDGTLDSAPATGTINVTPVNDAPVVVAGHTLSYTENQAATAFDPSITVSDVDSANLVSATVQITGNYANGQDILGFTNQNGITGSFDAATGTLTLAGSSSVANYQAALASVTYVNTSENPSGLARTVTIITNDGAANSTAVTDTITVTPVNDAPVTTAGGTLNYTENQVATAIDASVTVADVDSANMTGASVQITGNYANGQDILGFVNQNGITGSFNAATGTLTLSGSSSAANYQTALDSVTYFNSSDNPSGLDRTVSYTVNDGTANSNISTSTIHVTPVNDAPVVNATGTSSFTENQGPAAIAPALTLSDADTATMTTASVQITGNYANGEDLLAFSNTANITGSFNAATGTLTLTGTDTVANYEAALRSVTYADNSENPSAAARTVTFTVDDGQAANHQSAGSNHTINVTAVDDAPVNNGVPANFTVMSGFTHAITGLSVSDIDANGGNDITTTLTSAAGSVAVGAVGGGAAITGNGTGAVTLTGTIAQINASLAGSVVYTAADGVASSTTTTLTIATNDHGHTGTGGPIIDTDVIQVGVTPQVWFINGDQTGVDATAPRGSQTNPFTDVHEFNTSSGPGVNDYIYVKAGTYTGEGINLKDGQTLLGDDQPLSLADPFGGPAIVIETASGARPTIHVTTAGDQGIDLASGNTVSGINIQTDAGTTGLDDGVGGGGGSVGSLTVNHMNITGAGQAVDIDQGGALNVTIDTLSSSGGAFGVQLGGALTGSFTGTTGTLSGHTTSEFDINGGTGNISYSGAINDGTGLSASVANHTGGTVAFSGGINDGADAGGGIALTGNTNGTINFTGGMTLNTGASNGFAATGGGTVNVTGTNHLTSSTGTALNITNTTIGSSNVTFQDISSTGSSGNAGIILDGTGSSGGLHVTGTGSAGSGGTISNKTGADILTGTDAGGQTTSGTNGVGIYLHNTSGVQLDRMQLNDFSNFAIYGNNVTNFSLDHSTISGTNGNNNAGDREESSVRFDNLLGTSSIDNSSISGGYNQNVDLYNTSGTLTRLTMDNDAFGLINATGGNDNVRGQVFNNATANYTVTNSTFAGTRSDFIAFLANNNATMDAVVRNNTFHNGQTIIPGGGTLVDIRSGSGGNVSAANTTYDISHNTALNTGVDAANAFDTVGIFTAKGQDNGTMSGTIASNTIGPAKANANADGIFVRSAGNGTDTVLIQNNSLTGYGNMGIHLQNNDGSSTMNASLFGNVLSNPNSQNFAGIFADNGATAGDTSTMNLVVGSANPGESAKQNTLAGSGVVIDVSLSNFNASTHFNLSKNGSPSGTAAGVIQDDNVGSPSVDTTGGLGPITLVGTVPALPPAVAPLLAASGGVQASTPNAGEMHLTQTQLDTVVAAAIAQWAAAGASASQLAALHATTFSVADLSGNTIGVEGAPSHITIDVNAAGHGWFVDPTPSDNFEFTHTLNGAGTDLLTDPTSAAAGHLDLLTTVSHEMGHIINLPDTTATSDAHDLMYINLIDGERRLPTAADVAQANAATFSSHIVGATAPPAPGSAPQAPASQPAASDGGHFGWGADTFVFAPSGAATQMLGFSGFANVLKAAGVDFSALFAAFHAPAFNDGAPGHLEGLGARLIAPQIDTRDVQPFHWMNSAPFGGATTGTPFDSHSAFHFEQHHGWLV